MTKRRASLKEMLDDFAIEVAKEARLAATPLDQKLDAFKALTAYHALELKRKKSHDDDDGGEPTMVDLQRAINGEGDARRRSVHDS